MKYLYKHRNLLVILLLSLINILLFVIFTQNSIELKLDETLDAKLLVLFLHLVQIILAGINLVVMWQFISDILPLTNKKG